MNLGLLLMRLIVGGIFAVHGYPKLFGGPDKTVSPEVARYLGAGFVQSMQTGPEGFRAMLEGMGVPEPALVAKVVGVAEFFGGILLVLGWFTRLASFALAVDMIVAISRVHWRNGLIGPGGFELPLSLLAPTLALFFGGPGKFSFDREK
jgi:putative oxidoreductase